MGSLPSPLCISSSSKVTKGLFLSLKSDLWKPSQIILQENFTGIWQEGTTTRRAYKQLFSCELHPYKTGISFGSFSFDSLCLYDAAMSAFTDCKQIDFSIHSKTCESSFPLHDLSSKAEIFQCFLLISKKLQNFNPNHDHSTAHKNLPYPHLSTGFPCQSLAIPLRGKTS